MAAYNEVKMKKTLIGKLTHGSDLLEQLTEICQDNGIRLGRVEALGAVCKARLAYYDQQKHKYEFIEVIKNLEITALVGNVSLRDGKPMTHAHITLSDADGHAYGGHLAPGTIVFACEFVMDVYDGPQFCRTRDEQTALSLWDI